MVSTALLTAATYKRICKVDLHIPDHVSPEAADVIKRVSSTGMRSSVAYDSYCGTIRKSGWLCRNYWHTLGSRDMRRRNRAHRALADRGILESGRSLYIGHCMGFITLTLKRS